jgi:hypothetical protein
MKALNRDQLPKAAIGATAAKTHFVPLSRHPHIKFDLKTFATAANGF